MASQQVLTPQKKRFTKIEEFIGIIPDTGDSVEEVRKIRRKLSKEYTSLEDLNSELNKV